MAFKEERKRAGRGLLETAGHLGVTKQAVNSWERGKTEPSISRIKSMAAFYGCSIDTLLSGEGGNERRGT